MKKLNLGEKKKVSGGLCYHYYCSKCRYTSNHMRNKSDAIYNAGAHSERKGHYYNYISYSGISGPGHPY
ncbi:hypothetical protein [Vagococcus silagei]|uniref:Uncharacterized protein n=1 Tax=Vagococcus silagei TaxID=2508885 RepID=A0A4V3TUW2_9ENTE|nr:hypothetical protein [Vagococcus silagei]THB60499.1 hypothetical protein ESZ54_09740 [Vagococcus silagei]